MGDNPRVFVSYASPDADAAERLLGLLRTADVGSVASPVDMPFGIQIVPTLRSQIDTADFLVLLLSPEALEAEWVQRELKYAVSNELRQRLVTVIPFKIKPCRIPEYLESWTVIDATRSFEKAALRLGRLLQAAPHVQIERLDYQQFESLVADLLRAYGFTRVRPTVKSADIGFDFTAQSVQRDPFGRPEDVDWLVEVKATKTQTDVSSLRSFLGALSLRKERGLFVTSSRITSPAREWLAGMERSGGPRIHLLEGPEIRRLVMAKPRIVDKYFKHQEKS